MTRPFWWLAAILVILGFTSVSSAAPAAGTPPFPGPGHYTHSRYVSDGDEYSYSLYVPSSYRPSRRTPLVVMIHGCNTTDDEQARASEFDPLAERHDFIVLYPDVDATDDHMFHCWKGLWEPQTESRTAGDAAAIAGMTREVMRSYDIDPARVYAVGMSSGAFETSILGGEFPDLYAAIGIASGGAFKRGANGCFETPYVPVLSTNLLAHEAFSAEGPRARVMPVILFHGDADTTIPYACGRQALAQWLQTDNLVLAAAHRPAIPTRPSSSSNGQVPAGHAYTVDTYTDRAGCMIAQFWTIHGMNHDWSGGSSAPASAPFTDPKGPSAADAAWAFFAAHRMARGAGAPCVTARHPRRRHRRHRPRRRRRAR